MTGTTGNDTTPGTPRETPEPAGSADGTAGKAEFRHMLAQAAADLEDIRKAQDRAIASLERVRARLEDETADRIAEGVVSSMQGHLGVGKSEIMCDIDTLRMIGDRYDSLPQSSEYLVLRPDAACMVANMTVRDSYEGEARIAAHISDLKKARKQVRRADRTADHACRRILDLLRDAEKKNRTRAYGGLALSEIKKNMSAAQRNFAERELDALLAIGAITETRAAGDSTVRYRLAPRDRNPEDKDPTPSGGETGE